MLVRYGNNVTNTVVKILTVDSIRDWWNLTVSQLGRVRIFKGEWI
jgi:hypothetical protein